MRLCMFTTANFPVHLSTDYYGANCGSALHTKKASLSSSLGLTHRMLRSSRLSGESIPPTCCLEMVFIDRKTSHSKWFPSAQFTMEVYWKKLNMIPFLCQILVLQDTGSARYWFCKILVQPGNLSIIIFKNNFENKPEMFKNLLYFLEWKDISF